MWRCAETVNRYITKCIGLHIALYLRKLNNKFATDFTCKDHFRVYLIVGVGSNFPSKRKYMCEKVNW